MAQEERVPFVAKPGVTIYHGGPVGWPAGTDVHLPKSHADELAHLRAEEPKAEAPKPSTIKKADAPAPVAEKPQSA